MFTTTKKIVVPSDMDGLKMRVPGGAATLSRYEALGAVPVVISISDVPQALQRGTVDGIWSTQESVRSSKLFDSGIKYGFEDRQAFLQYVPMISRKAWDSYPPDLQDLIQTTWNDLVSEARKKALGLQEEARQSNADNGIETVDPDPEDMAPDARDPSKKVPTMMTTADMALKMDPEYRKISERFRDDQAALDDAFARAWFKLCHRDMGPKVRYLGPEVPDEDLIWQDPVPAGKQASDSTVSDFKSKVLDSGLGVSELVKAAWASASTYRKSDHRGGANGAHIRLEPMKNWAVNDPEELGKVLSKLDELRGDLSMADAIVIAGSAAVEKAARDAGFSISVPVTTGRGDATAEQTDAESFEPMEPFADGFRNYLKTKASVKTEDMLIDRASLLGLSIPEMTVLVGGMRALGAVSKHAKHGNRIGVLTDRPGQLTNDFFVNILDMGTKWEVIDESGDEEFVGRDRKTGEDKWHATRTDLVFGSNSQLRAVAEVYAENGHQEKFLMDFVSAWTKVMDADRFDLSYAKYH